jgi:hypothetical protein
LNSPDEETDTDTDTETPMPSPPSNDDEHGLKNDPTVLTTPEAYQSLTQISHAGQWEAITGGDAKTPLTLDAAQKALSNPDSKLSDDTKKTLQWTVDNWAAVAGDNSKSLSLEQAQKLGTTPTTDASSPDKAPLEKGIYLPKDQFMSGFSQDLPPDQNSDVKGFDATQQQNVGDCRYLSIARGISETDKGKKYLRDAIHKNENGSYDIKFAGADKAIHVGTEDLDEQGEVYAKGDPDMIAIAAATSKYYQSDTPNKVSEEQLYTGVNPTVIKARTDSDSNFYADLKGVAPHLGKDVSIAMGGAPGKDGEFDTDASNHCFQISKIDFNETSPGESIVHYTNPWDSSQDRTLSASDLYQKLHNGDQNTGIWATQVS